MTQLYRTPEQCLRIAAAWMLAITTALAAPVAWSDPPARIARLSYAAGTATFSPAGDDQWGAAILNRPVATGDRLWADDGARVELTLDNGALWLGAATSVVVTNIDDATTQFELQQGTLELRVRRMASGSVVEIDTPNLAFQVTRPGRYRIAVDPQDGTTTVFVRNGNAAVYGEGASYAVGPGQGYRFFGTDLRDSELVPVRGGDPFERFVLERDARFNQSGSARYVSQEVVGYEDLDRYGTWQPSGAYGNVWFPRQVAHDWAPYRQGHWSWIDPWGWTWVDDAPWGFAPFHYGRWAFVESRWGWVPGPRDVRPVYAPALVAFIGGANFSVSVSSGPAIGWFPLAPREVYRPAYNVSRDYYRQVNVSNTVINTTVINNTYVTNFTAVNVPAGREATYANLRARNAVTAVPPAAFAQSLPVGRAAMAMSPMQVDRAQVRAMADVAPTRAAFIGGAPAAKSVPPRARDAQVVVARAVPPAPPVPIAERLPALDKAPGKPQERAEIRAERPANAGPGAERNVRVVNAGVPPATVAPPAVPDSSRNRATPPAMARPVDGAPAPSVSPGAVPVRTPDGRGGPPGQEDRGRRIDSPATTPAPSAAGSVPAARGAPQNAAPTSSPRPQDARLPSAAPPATAATPTNRPPVRDETTDRGRPPAQAAPARAESRAPPQPPPRPEPQPSPQVAPPPEPRATQYAPSRPAPAPAARPSETRPGPSAPAIAPAARPPEATPDRSRGAPQRDATPDTRAAPASAPPRPQEARPTAAPPQARSPEPRATPVAPVAAPAAAAPTSAPPQRGAPPKVASPPDNRRDDKADDKLDDKRGNAKGRPD